MLIQNRFKNEISKFIIGSLLYIYRLYKYIYIPIIINIYIYKMFVFIVFTVFFIIGIITEFYINSIS